MKKRSSRHPKECVRCRAPLTLRRIEHPYWSGPTLVAIVRDVPAWVCQLCNHHYFDTTVETTLRYIVADYVRIGALFPIPTTPYRTINS